jgi:membrane-associated phospholipid phosphatase
MFDPAPVLWLQQWTSPGLTTAMLAVSLMGYVPSCLAVAVAYAFGWRFRHGVVLVLAVVFANVMTAVAKDAFRSPRPATVDARVRAPAGFESRWPATTADGSELADDYGFPSGHVATTAAWAVGLALVGRRRRDGVAAGIWIALMAVSRMYLGRHFAADVLGGLAIGIAALVLARRVVPPDSALEGTSLRRAVGLSLLGLVPIAALAGAGLSAHETARFVGILGAALIVLRRHARESAVTRATRAGSVFVALVLLGVGLWSHTWTAATTPMRVMTMAASAALYASVLLVPAWAIGRRPA